MAEEFKNKYEKEAQQLVEGLQGTKWEAAISPEGDHSDATGTRSSGFLYGLLALTLFAIWRLR
jgi:hypothetical protein